MSESDVSEEGADDFLNREPPGPIPEDKKELIPYLLKRLTTASDHLKLIKQKTADQ